MNNVLVERYETLRSFALDRQGVVAQRKSDYMRFIRNGMGAWIDEEAIKVPDQPTSEAVFAKTTENSDFHPCCEPQILQTIAGILFKKIKETTCYC